MTQTGRRSTGTALLKALSTVAVVVVLVWKVPVRDVGARLSALPATSLSLLAVLTLLQVGLSSVRTRRLLLHLGEAPPLVPLFLDTSVGILYNLVLPTSVGGDVVRALRMGKRLAKAHRAWSVSVFERLSGLLAMALCALLSLAWAPRLFPPWMAVSVTVFGTLFTGLFFVIDAPFRLLVGMWKSRPHPVFAELTRVSEDLRGPLGQSRVRAEAVLLSVGVQALATAYIALSIFALGDAQHFLAAAISAPIILVLSMLPITLGGHGLREGLFVLVLGVFGVEKGVALGAGILWLCSSLLFAVLGVIALLALPPPDAPFVKRAGPVP